MGEAELIAAIVQAGPLVGLVIVLAVAVYRMPVARDAIKDWNTSRVRVAELTAEMERERTERLFGLRYRIEIYTPAEKRTHGYYVLPFLEGEAITARVDLKADRKEGVLIVQHAHAEPDATAQTPHILAVELRLMSEWLGLGDVRVVPRGDLAERLADALT